MVKQHVFTAAVRGKSIKTFEKYFSRMNGILCVIIHGMENTVSCHRHSGHKTTSLFLSPRKCDANSFRTKPEMRLVCKASLKTWNLEHGM